MATYSEDGCTVRCGKSGLCSKHWFRRRCNGTLAAAPRCSVTDCARGANALGLCGMHYKRKRRGSDMSPERVNRPKNPGAPCEAAGCDRTAIALGLCGAHWNRHRMGKDMSKPVRITRRGAERKKSRSNHQGYVMIYCPTHPNANGPGYVLEHRKVMSDSLQRPLEAHENVHHKNGQRSDNRLVRGHEFRCPGICCNLELWSYSQPPGQRVEDKVAWAKEILGTYEPGALR